jgi:hypothetical protein
MKWFSMCLLLSLSPVFGQTSVDEFLAEGLKKVSATKTTISQEDQKALVAATSTVLVKHITFRADGTASTYFTLKDRRSVEWKKFVIADIMEQTVTEADKLNGVTKKYSVVFGCDAHRAWDTKTNRWGEWLAHGYSDFPLGIIFQLKNGKLTPEMPALLKHFMPGPGTSVSQSLPKPADKTNTLPPGMQKQ